MNCVVMQYGSVVRTLACAALEYHEMDLKEVAWPRSSLSLNRSCLFAHPRSPMPPGPLAMSVSPWVSSWMLSGGVELGDIAEGGQGQGVVDGSLVV